LAIDTKSCPKCGAEKVRTAFYADKSKANGLSTYCRGCCIEASHLRQNANPEKYRKYLRRYYRKNLTEAKLQRKAWYEANREGVALVTDAWRRANPAKANEYSRRYRKANPAKRAMLIAKYRAAQFQRTPPWLTQAHLAEIEGQYHFAKVMERITGRKYHVDHIEPLQGEDVSGLHVPWNLRSIPAIENISKGNRRT
jgi:hypothetical protein